MGDCPCHRLPAGRHEQPGSRKGDLPIRSRPIPRQQSRNRICRAAFGPVFLFALARCNPVPLHAHLQPISFCWDSGREGEPPLRCLFSASTGTGHVCVKRRLRSEADPAPCGSGLAPRRWSTKPALVFHRLDPCRLVAPQLPERPARQKRMFASRRSCPGSPRFVRRLSVRSSGRQYSGNACFARSRA
jgi:hypothetical protein